MIDEWADGVVPMFSPLLLDVPAPRDGRLNPECRLRRSVSAEALPATDGPSRTGATLEFAVRLCNTMG